MQLQRLTTIILTNISLAFAGKALDLQVKFRGQIHEINGVSTLTELQEGIENLGLEKSKQGILFQGKNLLSSNVAIGDSELSDLGLTDGSVLNVVPKKKKSSSSSNKSLNAQMNPNKAQNSAKAVNDNDLNKQMNQMEEMLKAQGIDPEELKNMLPEDGKMPDPADAMKMMQDMMSNPVFDEYMNDEAKLEESRQQILNNPMMKAAMQNIPGFNEILNSKEMWRDTMRAAAQMYKNMGPEELSAMMNMGMGGGMPGMGGGMPGMGGMGGGMPNMNDLFGGNSGTSALDELSEGDD